MNIKRHIIGAGIAALTLVGISAVPAAAAGPASPEHGCHGYYTTHSGGPGVQGAAIGGLGASDGDATNGQAHSEAGRGAILLAFLEEFCA